MKDLYKLLEVNETASEEVIKAAYKTLALRNHPDRAKDNERIMKEEKMKELNYAREILLDPVKREKYDMELRLERNRQQNEIIQSKVNQHKERETKIVQSVYKQKEPDTPTAAVGGAFAGFLYLLRNPKKNKNLLFLCTFLFLFAFAQIFLCFYLFNQSSPSNNSNKQLGNGVIVMSQNLIVPNKTTENEIRKMFGDPNEGSSDNIMQYKQHAKILLNSDDIVVGWIDNYKELDFRRYNVDIRLEDISVGMTKQQIITQYGYPDTYSESIFVYNNIIIYLENDVVVKVEKE